MNNKSLADISYLVPGTNNGFAKFMLHAVASIPT